MLLQKEIGLAIKTEPTATEQLIELYKAKQRCEQQETENQRSTSEESA